MSFGIPLRSGVFVGAASVVALGSWSRTSVNDFRAAMPAGSTYTRTGAATGLTAAGTLTAFAADAPQRTDRGLALEPAATNILINSVFANSGGNRPTSWDEGIITGVSAPVASTILNTAFSQSGTAQRAWFSQTIALAANSSYIYSVYVEATTGTPGSVAYGTSLPAGASSNVLTNPVVGRGTFTLTTAGTAGNGTIRTGFGAAANATGSIILSNPQFELGTVATSPILTTSGTATRGLPVFTEPVPAGRTKALLTYADATTTLVTGLTPGGTFDVATTVLAASKGVFGVSELVTRVWYP
jgi:hypothetical protein